MSNEHTHKTNQEELREVYRMILALEAATYRSQAQAIINQGIAYVNDAVNKLQTSRFSPTARLDFRARVSGTLRRSASAIANLGWIAGGGADGKYPKDILRKYMNDQQDYLSNWFRQIRDNSKLIGGGNRARAYVNSLMGLYNEMWAAAQKSFGAPELPATPRDGTTKCLMGCKCHWELKKVDATTYLAYWRISPAEHCETCLCRAKHWNPLTFTRNLAGVWESSLSNGPATCQLFS